MSDNSNEDQSTNQNGGGEDTGTPNVSELELLKGRARLMGVTFSNNIGVDALKAKIQAKMDGQVDTTNDMGEKTEQVTGGVDQINALALGAKGVEPTDVDPKPEKILTLKQLIERDALKLVRCRITNMDPKKKDLQGEIVVVANDVIGTVRRFVPFGEVTDDGWHIPQCIYDFLKARKFLNIRTARDRRTNTMQVTQSWSPEFGIEVLDPLTETELRQLAAAQIAAGSIDSHNGSANIA